MNNKATHSLINCKSNYKVWHLKPKHSLYFKMEVVRLEQWYRTEWNKMLGLIKFVHLCFTCQKKAQEYNKYSCSQISYSWTCQRRWKYFCSGEPAPSVNPNEAPWVLSGLLWLAYIRWPSSSVHCTTTWNFFKKRLSLQ